MSAATADFNAATGPLSGEQYRALVERLLLQGEGFVKINGDGQGPACLCLRIEGPLELPVQWGGTFALPAGGLLVALEREVPQIAEALLAIRNGAGTAEDLLLKRDQIGERAARFDIYGMDKGAFNSLYSGIELQESTRKAIATLHTLNLGEEMARSFTGGVARDLRIRPLTLKKPS
jgi:hypothetical protein